MFAILMGYAFVYEQYLTLDHQGSRLTFSDLMFPVLTMVVSMIFYGLAVGVYRRCNRIETTPVVDVDLR